MSSFTDKLKGFVSTVAPMLGTALGGPLGGYAGTLVAKALGAAGTDQKSMEAAMAAATPDQLIALRKAEDDFQVQMKTLQISEEKLQFDDTASARQMEVATKDSTPRNLSYLLLTFTGLVIAATMFGYTKVDSALAGSLIGYLVAENKAVMTFWFGGTRSSQEKDATIADIAKS